MERAGTILHVITSLDEGGAQRYLLLHCTSETRWHHKVVYLAGRGLYAAEFERLGIEVFDLRVRGAASAIAGMFRLRSLIARIMPSLVVGWMYHAILVATACLPGRPVIWNIRQTFSGRAREKRHTYLVLRWLGLLSRGAAAIIYNSHVARKSHEAVGYSAERAVVIHNGVAAHSVDAAAVARLRSQLMPSGDSCLVVNLGRYHPMKGPREFAMIAAEILERHENVVFAAVGAGLPEQRQALLQLLPAAVADRYLTLGHTDDPSVLLEAANVYLGTSLWGEAYPNSVAEAVAHHCHVLATDVGDTAAIIEGSGVLLVPGDVPQAVAILDGILARGDWRERKSALANEVLSLAEATRRYDALYIQADR